MRVLFVTWGWRSHFYPLVPLAWAIVAAGHEVRVATHPHLVPDVAGTGLPSVAVGADIDFAEAFASDLGPVAGPGEEDRQDGVAPEITPDGGIVRHAEAMVDDLVGFGRHWRPDLVVYDPFNIAAPLLAQLLGVPAVRHLWGPDFTDLITVDEPKVTGPMAARFGAEPVRLAGDLTIDPCPDAMQLPGTTTRQPVRFVPYNGTAIAPDWLADDPDRPRVCLTWGTLLDSPAAARYSLAPAIAEAVTGLGIELVVSVTTAQRGAFPADLANVQLAHRPIALHLLLPSCRAVIHQGGAGTTMTAMSSGTRQLIVPQITDQGFNADRLACTGAGRVLPGEEVTADRIRAELTALLGDDGAGAAAQKLRQDNETRPAPADLVPILERLALR
jgi:UDP:flavonoid glycosyltransferase YjiC (YdhE family)